MREADAEIARAQPLLAALSTQSSEALLKNAFLQRFPAHVDLIRQGEKPDFLHLIVEGTIEIAASDRDRETTITVLGPGQSFILAAVMLDKPYLKGARTLNPSRILMLPAEAVHAVFASDPAFAKAIVSDLAEAYRGIVKELNNQKLRTSLERLANWLLVLHADQGGKGTVQLPFEKRVVATRLGMSAENLSRNFATLASYGVEVQGRAILLKDIKSLTVLAKPSPLIDDSRH